MGAHILNDKLWLRGLALFFLLLFVWLREIRAKWLSSLGQTRENRLALVLPPQALATAEVWANGTNFELNLLFYAFSYFPTAAAIIMVNNINYY